jgi:N-acetylglutamate synthase-like GNAT family acetyltransferase
MQNDLKIRRYHKNDQMDVIALHKLALEQAGTFADSGKWDDDLQHIEEVYLHDGDFLVGEIDNKIVAMGALKRVSEDVAEIKRMRVHPDNQGKGFGQHLLTLLEQKAKELGYKKIILDTTIKQIPAQNLYIKNGYKETFRDKIEAINTENIHYEKELG